MVYYWFVLMITLLLVSSSVGSVRGAGVEISPPTIRPFGGQFVGIAKVTLDANTPDSKIYYTLDGTSPSNTSLLYDAARPLTLTKVGTTLVQTFAVSPTPDHNDSRVVKAAFTISAPDVPVPANTPVSGTYRKEVGVTLSMPNDGVNNNDNVVVRYTVDGTDPTDKSPQYAFGSEIMIRGVGEHVLRYYAQSLSTPSRSPTAVKVYTVHPRLSYDVSTECRKCSGPTSGVPFTVFIHGAVLGGDASAFLTTSRTGCDRLNHLVDGTSFVENMRSPALVFTAQIDAGAVYVCHRETSTKPYKAIPHSSSASDDATPFAISVAIDGPQRTATTKPSATPRVYETLPSVDLPDITPPPPGSSVDAFAGATTSTTSTVWGPWTTMFVVMMVPFAAIGVYCHRQRQRLRPTTDGQRGTSVEMDTV